MFYPGQNFSWMGNSGKCTFGNYLVSNLLNLYGGSGTKPAYKIMMIIPLIMVIELKATPNGNQNNDFYRK